MTTTIPEVTPRRAALIAGVGYVAIFVLAIFVGFEVITKVPPTLHTPLMSGSNAISGITIIGALILAGAIDSPEISKVLATVAERKARMARNPRTGEAVPVPARKVPVFKVSKMLKDRVAMT